MCDGDINYRGAVKPWIVKASRSFYFCYSCYLVNSSYLLSLNTLGSDINGFSDLTILQNKVKDTFKGSNYKSKHKNKTNGKFPTNFLLKNKEISNQFPKM